MPSTQTAHEYQQHRGRIACTVYAPDGLRLFTAGADGQICVYDTQRNYQPIKMVASDFPTEHAALAVSPTTENSINTYINNLLTHTYNTTH